MLKHHKKLASLCLRNGRLDMRRMKSKAAKKEFMRVLIKGIDPRAMEMAQEMINILIAAEYAVTMPLRMIP